MKRGVCVDEKPSASITYQSPIPQEKSLQIPWHLRIASWVRRRVEPSSAWVHAKAF